MVEKDTLRFTVRPRISTKVVIKTLPGAVCTLHKEDNTDSVKGLKLFADQDGIIRFHTRPYRESEVLRKMIIDCESNGSVTRYPLELSVSFKPTREMPAPPVESVKPPPEGTSILPALSKEDMLHLSDEELMNRHYPPRPNPEQAPGAFNRWCRAFSNPLTIIEPKTVSNPETTHGLMKRGTSSNTSNNWSGFVAIAQGGGEYSLVSGQWNVPHVNPDRLAGVPPTQTCSSFWVGLDGYAGLIDLVQAGTEQDCLTEIFPLGTDYYSYYAWTEFLPQQQYEEVITNFPANPGDEMLVTVWMGTPTSKDNTGDCIFSLTNNSTFQTTTLTTPRQNIDVTGLTAEWIMERPELNHQYWPYLAEYQTAIMNVAYAQTQNASTVVYYDDVTNLAQVAMTSESEPNLVLSSVTPINQENMQFTWQNFGTIDPVPT
jgi:hypothetical protein